MISRLMFMTWRNLTEYPSYNYYKQQLVAIKVRSFRTQQFYYKAIDFMGNHHRHSRVLGTTVLGSMYSSEAHKVSEQF